MPDPDRPLALIAGQTPSPPAALRAWLTRTFSGRALLVGLVVKVVTTLTRFAVSPLPSWLDVIDKVGSLALIFAAAYLIARFVMWARRRLLWRVRRKLILSYIFVGLVPGLLIVTFFLLAGLLLFFNVSSYLVQSRVRSLGDQARFLAESTVLDLQRSVSPARVDDTLDRRQESAESRYPFLSVAVVPVFDLRCPDRSTARAVSSPLGPLPIFAGPWRHLDPPERLPPWVGCEGFSGLLAYEAEPGPADPDGAEDRTQLVMRAVAFPDVREPGWALVLDLPITATVGRRIREETGIVLGEASVMPIDDADQRLAHGRMLVPEGPADAENAPGILGPQWVVFLDYQDWEGGDTFNALVGIQINVWEIYDRISAVSSARMTSVNFGQLLLAVLALVGALFLVIQFVALMIGFALARQITGAVHDLFTGTEHLRNRQFSHQIPVRARDQLGELAESFNVMTGEITVLLLENAKKERLEQELRTARDIQMKLLPQGPLLVPGLAVTAYCEPAREVGGDYYDFLPLDDRRLGFLIADVSGKGTSAALYMAELKGLMLSLSRIHESPRELLIAANHAIAPHIDAKSFITMSYIVIDLDRSVMTYARAGHCPLIYLPGMHGEGPRHASVLAPDGLVVGLKLDDGGALFDSLLEEVTVPLRPGDLIVLFTDGFSEAMNESFDCFGEQRLSHLIEQHGDLPFEELRERIVMDVRSFAGSADQHDDMTMLLLKVEDIPVPVAQAFATV
ncbi:MAG: SpoIIE family protein phosphatase [Acidobacteria bacterium]|nr:SpoIIE family protein phosphatase [Acidobacteriota bacterium]